MVLHTTLFWCDGKMDYCDSENTECHKCSYYTGAGGRTMIAEVAPVIRGIWEEYFVDNSYYYKCSKCDSKIDEVTNYCPHCGAIMTPHCIDCDECPHYWLSKECDDFGNRLYKCVLETCEIKQEKEYGKTL